MTEISEVHGDDDRHLARSIALAAMQQMLASGVPIERAISCMVATALGFVVQAHGPAAASYVLRQFAENLDQHAPKETTH